MSLGGFGCVKIIQSQPGHGDHCGCPFRHERQEDLRAMIAARGVGREGVEDVMRLVKSGDYQVACTRLFSLTHGGVEPLMPISHPNKFFDESRKIAAGGAAPASTAGGVKAELSATQQLPGVWGGGPVGEKVPVGSASQPALVGNRVEGEVVGRDEEKEEEYKGDQEKEEEMKEAESFMTD